MEDVTNLMLTYREAVRHLWNAYFVPREDEEMLSLFAPVESHLFYALVVWPLGQLTNQDAVSGDFPFGRGWDEAYPHRGFGLESLPYLQIVPTIAPRGTEVIWRRPTNEGMIHDVGTLTTDTIDLRFITLYDYDQHENHDWRYYQVRVYAYPDDPAKEGTDMLIAVPDARVFFLDIGDR